MPLSHLAAVAGRVLIALLFVAAGAVKILGPKPYLDHMARRRIPAPLLVGVIVLELGAGGAVLAGWNLRCSAGALALFCLLTAAIFHTDFADKTERTAFMKDLAICGGLLAIAAAG
ncbi:MAG TPA: DoxX family protein [Caulobacteraceae bacterium]|jgi:putative oxidoreductase